MDELIDITIIASQEEMAMEQEIALMQQQKGAFRANLTVLARFVTDKAVSVDAVRSSMDFLITYYKRKLRLGRMNFKQTFWTELETAAPAALIAKTQKKLYGDDLIEMADAAVILRGIDRAEYSKNGRMRTFMAAMVSKPNPSTGAPNLTLYYLPGQQHPKRVSRREVLALKEELKFA